MSEQAVLRSPQVVAKQLDISPATLRRWSDEFQTHLSAEANPQGQAHRRYNDNDMAMLLIIKELLNDGLTYEQAREKLASLSRAAVEPDDIVPGGELEMELEVEDEPPLQTIDNKIDEGDDVDDPGTPSDATSLVTANGSESPAIAFLTNTLSTLSDSQKSILNSQAANRELLGVLLQDNFNLKEENNRLRERILEVERNVSQSQKDEEWRREALRQELETKIATATQVANEAITTARSVETPEVKTVENNSGCLGMLFGGGKTQVVTTPRRRKKDEAAPPTAGDAAAGQAGHHPKPMFPPE